MARGLTAGQITELAKGAIHIGHLVEFQLSTGTLYYTDRQHNVVYNANTYTATGNILGIEDIEETYDLNVQTITFIVSGANQANISALLGANYLNRKALVYFCLFNSSYVLINDPILIFSGLMDGFSLSEDPESGSSIVSIKASSQWADFERVTGRRTNDVSQQRIYSGDKGLEFAAEMDQEIVWGGEYVPK